MRTQLDSYPSPSFEIVHLTKTYAQKKVINNFSFSLNPGEVLGIIGPSGAGKSTLLKLAAGLIQPCVGYGRICGFDLQDQVIQARRNIGYLSEGSVGFEDMSLISFLKLITCIRGIRGASQRIRIDAVVGQLQLEHLLHLPLGALTYGENRMVGLAQAVVHDPAVLILDEPSEGMDPNQQAIFRSMIEIYSSNSIVIIATRLLDDVTAICSRAMIISNGRLCADGTLQKLKCLSRYYQSVTISTVQPLDVLALAVLPGVAGIETSSLTTGAVTILAKPGYEIFPSVLGLIVERRWQVRSLSVDGGRLDDVFKKLTKSC